MNVQSNSANGAVLSPAATEIETWSGRYVDLYDPDPETVELDDIASALGNVCRYGGHVERFYSVAEHSLLVHDLLHHLGAGPSLLAAGLFHDAAEAYLGDVVAPQKLAQRAEEFTYPFAIHRASRLADFRGAYSHLTERIDQAIATRFGLDASLFGAEEVRLADMWALRIEAAALTRSGGANWRWPGELPAGGELPLSVIWRGGLSPTTARRSWRSVASLAITTTGAER